MKVKKIVLGFFSVNCYIVSFNDYSFIIDPGAEFKKIKSIIDSEKLNLSFIINTHGHYDHIGAIPELIEEYNIPFYIHPKDEEIIKDPAKNFSSIFSNNPLSLKTYNLINDEVLEDLIKKDIYVYNMPGHTPGSIVIKVNKYLFTGDLLFRNGVGRTDLYGGNQEEITKSLEELKKFDRDLIICPGHGANTTLGYEIENNYFLRNGWMD